MTTDRQMRAHITLAEGEHRIHVNAMPDDLEALYEDIGRTVGNYPYWLGWGTVGPRKVLHIPESEGADLLRSLARAATAGSGLAGQARARIKAARVQHLREFPHCPNKDDLWP